MAELSDIEGKALPEEERERLSAEQLTRCKSIAGKMMQIVAKHVNELEIGDDEKKMNDSVEPIVETILKMQREDGMIWMDQENVKVLFLMTCGVVAQKLEKHYHHAYSDAVEFKVGKPLYEVTMQDIRSMLEERAVALAPKTV